MRRGASIEQDQIFVFVGRFGRLYIRGTVPANKRCWAEEGMPHLELFHLVGYYAV